MQPEIYTVSSVAAMMRRTPGRIRQICRAHGIGYLLQSDIRILTPQDVQKIREIIANDVKAMREAARIEYVGKYAEAAAAGASAPAAPAAPAVVAPAASGGLDPSSISKGMGLK